MNIESKIWRRRESEKITVNNISEELGISRITSQILVNRGLNSVDEVNHFLNPNIENLHDPFLLKGMSEAVARITKAISSDEKIWIYGDYDVDGITSITVMIKIFEKLGYSLNYYIPNRLLEGYGISETGINKISESGCNLIISVDCGITAVKQVEYAKTMGIDFIISDHHECQSEIPNAVAVINPKQKDCKYPYDMLAGVGVAFKIGQALYPDITSDTVLLNELLNITALGSVADIAPVNGENRILVKHGIETMMSTTNLGLSKLIEVSDIKAKKMTTGNIGFRLGPRINAAGRIGEPELGVKLFTTKSFEEAEQISKQLSALNDERQSIERIILEEAIEIIENDNSFLEDKVLVVGKEGWHTGIIGIVASKICDKYYKPVVLLRIEDGIAKGSARSISEFSIFEGLNNSSDILLGFGGHELAAGLSLDSSNVKTLRTQLNNFASDKLSEYDLIPKVKIDTELEAKDINYNLLGDIDLLEPFGLGNPKPVFVYQNLVLDQKRTMGKNKEHIKLITHDGNRVFESVGFHMEIPDNMQVGNKVDMVFQVDRNDFKGVTSLQFLLKDFRVHESTSGFDNSFIIEYYSSLKNALLDDITYEKNNIPICIDLRNKDSKSNIVENLVDEQRNTLILIHTPTGVMDFLRTSLDYNHIDWLEEIQYNTIVNKHDSNITVIVNPKYSEVDFEIFDQVIVYDIPYSKSRIEMLLNRCKTVTVLYNVNDENNLNLVLNNSIPDRNDLANLYVAIKNSKYNEIALKNNLVNKAKMDFGLMILTSLNLIEQNIEKNDFSIIDQGKKKINIFDTKVYQDVQDIKNEFDDFKSIAHKRLS